VISSGHATTDAKDPQDRAGNILELIRQGTSFLITSQLDPDGDSVGSQLALRRLILAEIGENNADRVAIVNQVGCPKRYAFLPDSEKIVPAVAVGGRTFDVGFVLDGGVDRTGTCRPLFEACRKKVIIDHHKTTQAGGYDVAFIEPSMSSTAEMVFTLFSDERARATLNPAIATQLYLGIIYDTGSFQYALTTARTHRVAARLLEEGIRHAEINERVMLDCPLNAKQLLGRTLNEMKVSAGGTIVWTTVSQNLAAEMGTNDEDVRGIITQMIFIEGVRVALLFCEKDGGKVKLSLRSR
jgi:bifunctional oligoribonuclease and PAP phosphatase NrnA